MVANNIGYARVLQAVILMLAAVGNYGSGQQGAKKCPVEITGPRGPEYRIGLVTHAMKTGGELYLYISIEPQHFNREDMTALAKRLNDDFCYEKKLIVILLDDYYAARRPLRNSKSYWDAERGIYQLNRTTGHELIKFSSSRNKPQDEVVINLGAMPNKRKAHVRRIQ